MYGKEVYAIATDVFLCVREGARVTTDAGRRQIARFYL